MPTQVELQVPREVWVKAWKLWKQTLPYWMQCSGSGKPSQLD